MKITISVIKADIGSIGGHIRPSQRLVETVREHVAKAAKGRVLDSYVGHTGDDIAIVAIHCGAPGDEAIHPICWEAFVEGTAVAKVAGPVRSGAGPA